MAAKYDIIFSILARGARVCHVTDPIKRQVGRAVSTVGTATPGKSFDISITSLSRLFISFAVIWSMLYNQVFVWSVILFSTSQLRTRVEMSSGKTPIPNLGKILKYYSNLPP